jgi:mannitol-1-phosphate/altronate dehydrogenase
LAGLAKQLDKLVADNRDNKLAAILNFTEATEEEVKAFAKKHDITHVALTVTEDGPRFKVHEDATLTVMYYRRKKVVFNHAVKDQIGKGDVKAILAGAKLILEDFSPSP